MKTWNIDTAHSEIKFKVKHLVVSTVTGHFDTFSGYVQTEGNDFTNAKVYFEADVNSINTKQAQRDGHLKSADFFDAENHPKLTFKSVTFSKKTDDHYLLSGDLTIRGTTKMVILDVIYNGTVKGFGGDFNVAGFEISGKINRKDFGLNWSALTEAGGVVVADEVKLEITAELIEQVAVPA
ncbi:polyisoprenoid-binding protein [bacterium]|nr:MAG: polyisoprenoid-binding protein [bacterium]